MTPRVEAKKLRTYLVRVRRAARKRFRKAMALQRREQEAYEDSNKWGRRYHLCD